MGDLTLKHYFPRLTAIIFFLCFRPRIKHGYRGLIASNLFSTSRFFRLYARLTQARLI
ncbi:MAG: hypothetical protein RMJ55_10100 [Roseiflexaceae bacterium]|nr:hypothetical protein [Roseiflexus sp.]MDW8213900.1 hypothetical protein [Roseiflexaceae bacterium]